MGILLAFMLGLTPVMAEREKYWYEYPGIVLGGATVGMLYGPEIISVRESGRRYKQTTNRSYFDNSEKAPWYLVGWLLHAGTTAALLATVPPAGFAYLGMSGVLGCSQFVVEEGYD